MFADTEPRYRSLDQTPRGARGRVRACGPLWAVALAAVAAGLLAAAPAGAEAAAGGATMFLHSAKSGELGGGRLTLLGVGRRVTWATNGGRSGVVTVRRLHRLLFSRGLRRRPARSISRAGAVAPS
jgi:hypothetical protein